ncbi:unnamed protein product [Clavelina lepadiformis]|uniref:Uncharacterized protein n=1 Tax=Clavelina lepadiformis TaxID=159417 RepID=A0ABP0G5W0_CLALP
MRVPVLLLFSGVCLVNCQHFESEKIESGEHSTCYEDIKFSVYEQLSEDLNGNSVSLSQFKGNVSILINVASY